MGLFPVKQWEDWPSQKTPRTAAAYMDLEKRVTDWADTIAGGAVSVRAFGVVGDGSDETLKIQAALAAAAGRTLIFDPFRTYVFTAQLSLLDHTWVVAYGAKFVPSLANSAVYFTSGTPRTPVVTYPLTVDGATLDFTVTVSVANAANLSVGMRVQIKDPTYVNNGEGTHRETNVIEAVNGGSGLVTLKYPVGHPYPTANACWIAPVAMVTNVRWMGGEFDMTSTFSGSTIVDYDVIKGDWAENCLVMDVTAKKFSAKVCDLYGSLNSEINGCNGYDPTYAGPGQGYVMRMNYCRDCVIVGGWSLNVRHHSDIVGGHNCGIVGGKSAGRPTGSGADFNTGAFLHGCESRWCYIREFRATNMTMGIAAGNGTFTGDFDFEMEDCAAMGCDTSFLNFKSTGRVIKPWVRNPKGDAIVMTNTGAEWDVIEPDIDMGATTFQSIATTGLVSGNKYRVRGGTIRHNNAGISPIQMSVPVGAEFFIDGTTFQGTGLRGVYMTGAGTDVTVKNCKFKGTLAEAIRSDNGEIRAFGNHFGTGSTTCIRAATTCARITHDGNDWGAATFRVGNTSSAIVVGQTANITEGAAAPAAGAWLRGDICYNTTPSAAGIPGWRCTAAGTPGTWKAEAVLAP